jgi:hypothetical protein
MNEEPEGGVPDWSEKTRFRERSDGAHGAALERLSSHLARLGGSLAWIEGTLP